MAAPPSQLPRQVCACTGTPPPPPSPVPPLVRTRRGAGYGGNVLPSRHFSGYVLVDEAHGRRLFYYFVEAETDPMNAPVVLWMNG